MHNRYPKNKRHFLKLIPFAKKIMMICKEAGITPIIHGSFAHFVYTQDKGMDINDIDVLVPENSFKKISSILRKKNISYKYKVSWHSMPVIAKNKDMRVELDSRDYYYQDNKGNKLRRDFKAFNFYGLKVKMISLNSLEKLYDIAYARSKDSKRKIAKKRKLLRAFLDIKRNCSL